MDVVAITYEYDEDGVNVAALVANGRASGPFVYCLRFAGAGGIDVTRHFYSVLAVRGMHIEPVPVGDMDYLARELSGAAPWTVFEHVGGVWREAVTA